MSEKLKTHRPIRSFADMPVAAINTVQSAPPTPRAFNNWDVGAMVVNIIGQATETLQSWMSARLAELHRQKVAMEDITIVNHGGRTIIRVLGKDRFEFKIKCSMEER